MPENYNQLVLSQLQALSQAIEALRGDLQGVRQEIAELKAKEDKVVELKDWKQKIDEVASPTQLAKLVEEVQDLNNFKTKAVTIFAVVQFAMGVIVLIIALSLFNGCLTIKIFGWITQEMCLKSLMTAIYYQRCLTTVKMRTSTLPS
jgi:hypothetical protein